jgi:hypothetical protein
MIEWMCTQERFNPDITIIFGATARYRRATAGSSHDDAHPDNSALHTEAIRPHTGFVASVFFISPCSCPRERTGFRERTGRLLLKRAAGVGDLPF